MKAKAAEGVAAFRARFASTRNVEPAKTSVDQALEQLKAAAEARREQEAKKSKGNDRQHGLDQPRRDRSKDGPDFER